MSQQHYKKLPFQQAITRSLQRDWLKLCPLSPSLGYRTFHPLIWKLACNSRSYHHASLAVLFLGRASKPRALQSLQSPTQKYVDFRVHYEEALLTPRRSNTGVQKTVTWPHVNKTPSSKFLSTTILLSQECLFQPSTSSSAGSLSTFNSQNRTIKITYVLSLHEIDNTRNHQDRLGH